MKNSYGVTKLFLFTLQKALLSKRYPEDSLRKIFKELNRAFFSLAKG